MWSKILKLYITDKDWNMLLGDEILPVKTNEQIMLNEEKNEKKEPIGLIKKLNGGRGAILCNNCRRIILQDIDLDTVEEIEENLYCKDCLRK